MALMKKKAAAIQSWTGSF